MKSEVVQVLLPLPTSPSFPPPYALCPPHGKGQGGGWVHSLACKRVFKHGSEGSLENKCNPKSEIQKILLNRLYLSWHSRANKWSSLGSSSYWVIWIFVYSPQYWTSNTSLGSYSCFGQVTGSGESRVNYVVGYVLWPFY